MSPLRLLAVGALVFAALTGLSSAASAQEHVRGAADARLLVDLDTRLGASASIDLWRSFGQLQLGGVVSVGAISAGGGESSRVFAPVGLSLALLAAPEESGPALALRGGAWLGAIKGDIHGHAWAGAAIGYRFAIGEGASLRAGADLWALFGPDSLLMLGPYVGLGW